MSAEWDAEYARQLQMEEVERVRRLQNRSGGTQQGSSRDVEHGSADAFGGMLSQGDEEYSVGIEDFGSQGSVHDVGGAAGGSGRGMAAEHLHGGLEPFELFMYRHGLTAGGQLPGTEFRRLQSAKRAPIRENWPEGLHRFQNGAIRMTATPGRLAANAPNIIRFGDVFRKEAMASVWINAYMLEEQYVFRYLPLLGSGEHGWRDAPVYISRDVAADGMRAVVAVKEGRGQVKPRTKKEEHARESELVSDLYKKEFGANLKVGHPWTSGGIAHSKCAIIDYGEYVTVIITSANFIRMDHEIADNMWYVQSFPKFADGRRRPASQETDFERRLLAHAETLAAPPAFIARIRGRFDFSAATNVHFFTSESGTRGEDFGVLRLSSIARRLAGRTLAKTLRLEVCVSSVGVMNPRWLRRTDHLMKGGSVRTAPHVPDDDEDDDRPGKQKWDETTSRPVIVYPSKNNVLACPEESISAATNVGCAMNGVNYARWLSAESWVRALFHEYDSQEPGRMYHLKQYMWIDPAHPSALPALVAFGSANFSQGALGVVSTLRNGEARVTMSNYEIGIAVTGAQFVRMLEPGSSWEAGITYQRPPRPYHLKGPVSDRAVPWNSPAWVKNQEE